MRFVTVLSGKHVTSVTNDILSHIQAPKNGKKLATAMFWMLITNIWQRAPENKLNQCKEQGQINVCTKYGVGAMKETFIEAIEYRWYSDVRKWHSRGQIICYTIINSTSLHYPYKSIFVNMTHDLQLLQK